MAGGNWTTQTKVRPGVYINFESEPSALGAAGSRGIVSLALPLGWGQPKTMLTVEAGENPAVKLGYDLNSPQLLLVREALKRAGTLLLYRLNTGTKASAELSGMTVTAAYGGIRGNDISIVVENDIDDEDSFIVRTLVDGTEADRQSAALISDLGGNGWVDFSGTGAPSATAGLPLTGGADGTVTNADHTDYLAALELLDFQTVALASADSALKALYTAFAKRLRDEEGKKVQAVVENYPAADHEGVVSVKNGVKLADGTVLTAAQATAWTAGALAGAQMNESLTYLAYDDAVDAAVRYTGSQIEAALAAGEFLFTPRSGGAAVEQDINTLTGFTPAKGKAYAKNRVIRVLDGIANDFKRIFEAYYLGRVNNNADGRSALRNECVTYLNGLQAINAIQNFDPQRDVAVSAGAESDSIVIDVNVQPVDAVEKIYMKVQVG